MQVQGQGLQPYNRTRYPTASKPIGIPVAAAKQSSHRYEDQNSLSPVDELTDSFRSVILKPPAVLKNPHTDRTEELKSKITLVDQDFHGLNVDEITEIAEAVVFVLSGSKSKGTYHEKKDTILPRTIYYDLTKKEAYVLLKTKGNLPAKKGGYKEGTRALQVIWPKRHSEFEVNKFFLLTSLDERKDSKIAHNKPFEVTVLQNIEALKAVFVPCHTFFAYQKIKKGTGEQIPKTCALYPFHPYTMAEAILDPRVETIHKIAFLMDVAKGLQLLHEAGIVHGDLKSSNVLISEDGNARLADFDFAQEFRNMNTPMIQRRSYGTLSHTAPELFKGVEILRYNYPQLDMYAFGVMAHEIGSGTVFWHPTITDLMHVKKSFQETEETMRSETAKFGKPQFETYATAQLLAKTIKSLRKTIVQKQESITAKCEFAKENIGKYPHDDAFDIHIIQDIAMQSLHPDLTKRASADAITRQMNNFYKL